MAANVYLRASEGEAPPRRRVRLQTADGEAGVGTAVPVPVLGGGVLRRRAAAPFHEQAPADARSPIHDPPARGRGGGRGRGRGRGAGPAASWAGQESGEGGADDARYMYGNYDRYYGYRWVDEAEDPRLAMMDAAWFAHADVLDIGCNTGLPALALGTHAISRAWPYCLSPRWNGGGWLDTEAKRHGPRRLVGIDLDAGLIARAERHLAVQASLLEPLAHWRARPAPRPPRSLDYFPLSCPLTLGALPLLPTNVGGDGTSAADDDGGGFPHNVHFVVGNMLDASLPPLVAPASFDTILWYVDLLLCRARSLSVLCVCLSACLSISVAVADAGRQSVGDQVGAAQLGR
jgi:SAM-dependent methyltransferase